MRDSLKAELIQNPDSEILRKVEELYFKSLQVSCEQSPLLFPFMRPKSNTSLLLVFNLDGGLVAYAFVEIKISKIAVIYFGPVISEEYAYYDILKVSLELFKSKGIWELKVLPPKQAITDISSKDFKDFFSEYKNCEDDFNWATVELDLLKTEEEIFKSFSQNHRRSIQKAIKANLIFEILNDQSAISEFVIGFCKMYKKRDIKIDEDAFFAQMEGIRTKIAENKNCGFFGFTKTSEGKIAGAILVLSEGSHAFYYRGYLNPEFAGFPVNHFGFFEAIKYCKNYGYRVFDFGGYSLNTQNESDMLGINRFKDGFGGHLIHYPKTIVFDINSLGNKIIKLAKAIKRFA